MLRRSPIVFLPALRQASTARSTTSLLLRFPLRKMSTAPTHNTWSEPLTKPIEQLGIYLAIIPDFVEGSKRMEVRGYHLEHAKAGFEMGWIISAGATFADDHGDNVPPKMTGSWFLFREESIQKARERLSKDVYVSGGAWDMSKATIQASAIAKH